MRIIGSACVGLAVWAGWLGVGLSASAATLAPIDLRTVNRLPLSASAVAGVPQALSLRSPQNAVASLNLAVGNDSASAAVYRVVVEQEANGASGVYRKGLPGFPVANVTFSRLLPSALACDDVGSAPFVEMDASSTVEVPAGEAGIVRVEFETADVFPRTYRGFVSIRRLDATEPAVCVPLTLTVEPRRLPALPDDELVVNGPVQDEVTFRLLAKLGLLTTRLSPSLFHFALGADGDFDMALFPPALAQLETVLARQHRWAEEAGVSCRWLVADDCRSAFLRLYGFAEDSAEATRLWPKWLAAAKWRLNCFGFPPASYELDLGTNRAPRSLVDAERLVSRTLGEPLPNIRAALLLEELTARRLKCEPQGRLPGADADTADIIVYGATSAGIAAAVAARRMGRTCTVIEPTGRIGGLTTGGLGATDIGNKAAFGGLSRRFYRDIASYYADPTRWIRQRPEDYANHGQSKTQAGEETMWTFEPSAALAVLESWEKSEGLTVVRHERLDRSPGGVVVNDGRIVALRTESGRLFRGKVFVDATYEGDLLAAAGVSYTVGREANAQYGETLNGIQRGHARYHQFAPGVSAYEREGDPASGLLPGLERDEASPDGAGDRRVQAYCFRMCLTDDPANRIPFAKPADYRESDYELLFRNFAALIRAGKVNPSVLLPWINSPMPNRKTDTNNRRGFSTDFVGGNWNYPEASYAERAEIERRHLRYQQGLMWTLANHPRVPEIVRAEVSRWGTCRDEFMQERGDGWQNQLYVREARRMVGEYVMTEQNCRGTRRARRSVALAAYQMDSHHVRRYVDADGCVRNEGDIQVHRDADGLPFLPYPIDYGAIVPKRGECANLLVPVCLSASHIAFGSIRMEPVFFALGQAAGTAASLCVEKECSVQDLKYPDLRRRLLVDGQRLSAD